MDEKDFRQVRQARRATSFIFLLCGVGVASWAPMVPLAKLRLGINEADLGLILLYLGAGAILTMPLAGILIGRMGVGKVILLSCVIMALMLPLLTIINTSPGLGIALFIFGSSVGALDVAMNSHAVVVEQKLARPVMSSFHALFSVGGLSGSIGFGLLMLTGLSPTAAAIVISFFILVVALVQYKFLLPVDSNDTGEHSLRFPRGPVILLGIFCFIFFLSEGAMLDWSGLFLKEYRGFGQAMAGAGYAVFSVAMAIMRFSGDGLVHRYGANKVVLYGALLAAAGLIIALFVPGTVATLGGFMMVGFGAANIVPILFSAAGNMQGYSPGIALAAVTTLGYAGQLAGPALIGFVAFYIQLPLALALLSIPMIATGVFFRRARK